MYLLLGYGRSNQSIEKYFIKENIEYLIYDDYKFNDKINLDNIKIIIKSNGINNDHDLLNEAKKRNIKIISDLQYFHDVTNNKNYCLVTGSNGKTTIVSLLEKCLKNTISIGNNCLPLFDYIDNNQYKVLEVSSFMLENINYINNKYNIISNIYPTHLEHHKSFVNYIKAKINFLKFLSHDDYIIYNKDDLIVNRIIDAYDCNKISVSLKDKEATIYSDKQFIFYSNKKILDTSNIKLIGNHNLYNIMLVLGVVINHKLIKENYIDEIYSYKGEKYRLQIIPIKDYKIVNDSKSTNFKALSVALDCFKDNIILIVGGKKRNDDYSLLTRNLYKIQEVFCYGENKEEFYNYFNRNKIKAYKYESLNEVIENINIEKYNTLLFSPGSVSYDQYYDYEERGKHFEDLIKDKYNF